MRIIKPSTNEDPRLLQKQMALDECNICPSCSGELILFNGEYDYTETHLFWSKKYTRTEFECKDCGCVFESDPYDFESKPRIDAYSIKLYNILIAFMCVGFIALGIFGFRYSSTFCDILSSTFIIFGCLGIIFWIIYIILVNIIYKKHNFYKEFEPQEVHRDIHIEVNESK